MLVRSTKHVEEKHLFLFHFPYVLQIILLLPQNSFFPPDSAGKLLLTLIPRLKIIYCENFLEISGFLKTGTVSYLTLNKLATSSKVWQRKVLSEKWKNDN
jgi:hypothetical protein